MEAVLTVVLEPRRRGTRTIGNTGNQAGVR